MQFTIRENLAVRSSLPKRGITCSNPQRAKRIIEHVLERSQLHTELWGIEIYTGSYKGVPVFVAIAPMGAAGSGFAFLEMFNAGVEYLVRYGSNDRLVTENNLHDVIIVDEADNLYGLMRDSGAPEASWGKSMYASPILVAALEEEAAKLQMPVKKMICHNVEDYHVYNFPAFSDYPEKVENIIKSFEEKNTKQDSWDMETAALFWRGEQFQRNVATVLQCLIKHPGKHPYESDHGLISKGLEKTFAQMIFDALLKL